MRVKKKEQSLPLSVVFLDAFFHVLPLSLAPDSRVGGGEEGESLGLVMTAKGEKGKRVLSVCTCDFGPEVCLCSLPFP